MVTQKHIKLDRLLIYLMLSFSILAAIYLFTTFTDIPVNVDAGFYISLSKAVMKGMAPTLDVASPYTPFIYYTYALWMHLFGTEFSTLVLVIYITNAFNALLLYIILSRLVDALILRLLLSLSYYYTIIICQGYDIYLEPFQTFFILLAYYFYLKYGSRILNICLIGLSFGISMMFKQYSALVFIGFMLAIWIDSSKSGTNVRPVFSIPLLLVFSSLPFLAYTLFTQTTLVDLLYAFWLPSKGIILSATVEQKSFSYFAQRVFEQLLHHNWLFVPVFLYAYLILFRKGQLRLSETILPIWAFSVLPLLVRQWGHYFQLIAPWSYIIWGMLLNESMQDFSKKGDWNKWLILGCSICLLIILPPFLFLSPTFYSALTGSDISLTHMALVIICFMVSVSVILVLGAYFSREKISIHSFIVVIALILAFQTMFLALKTPFNKMRLKKDFQNAEATKINQIFHRGSDVLVIDANELYVTCDFRNPIYDYISFGASERALNNLFRADWSKINNIVIAKKAPAMLFTKLNELGFKELMGPGSLRVSFFRRDTGIHNGIITPNTAMNPSV